ncbi:MAG: hypothetical protein JNL11_20060 [Bdellovibrionaceae bacterium]|nr:hypothetical protein [Pseudobdellovibrionaceae bacterium]
MRLSKTLVIFLAIFGVAAQAYEARPHFLSSMSGFMAMGLRQSCYAIDISSNTLPCNPAFIAKEKSRRFTASMYLGNNVSYLKEATDLSRGQANEDTIKKLFQRHEDDELQTQIELGHIQEKFGWSVTPIQVNYSTTFRNQVLPQISLYASLEEAAKVQFGSYLGEDWSFGIQLRYTQRRFVTSQFYLTDALVPGGSDLFEPRKQSAFFVEPAVLYTPDDNYLNPEFTVFVANAGYIDKAYSELRINPEYHFTVSINPEMVYGRYSLGLDMNFNKDIQHNSGPLTLGGFYEYGILRLFGSVARDENGIGFGVFNTWWNLGIVNKNEVVDNSFGNWISLQKTYLFLGIEI